MGLLLSIFLNIVTSKQNSCYYVASPCSCGKLDYQVFPYFNLYLPDLLWLEDVIIGSSSLIIDKESSWLYVRLQHACYTSFTLDEIALQSKV